MRRKEKDNVDEEAESQADAIANPIEVEEVEMAYCIENDTILEVDNEWRKRERKNEEKVARPMNDEIWNDSPWYLLDEENDAFSSPSYSARTHEIETRRHHHPTRLRQTSSFYFECPFLSWLIW